MSRVRRNRSTARAREFWATAESAAKKTEDWPDWKLAGINVKESIMTELNRENLIEWARDLYACYGEWEYWYDLNQYSSRPGSGHDCGCAYGELRRDFDPAAPWPGTEFHTRLNALGIYAWEISEVNDSAPDGPERAKAVQNYFFKKLGVEA